VRRINRSILKYFLKDLSGPDGFDLIKYFQGNEKLEFQALGSVDSGISAGEPG
jgi:hypothetical protein